MPEVFDRRFWALLWTLAVIGGWGLFAYVVVMHG